MDQEPPSGDAAPPDPTRLDIDPGVTSVEPPQAAQTDAFASWYRQDAPAGGRDAEPNWPPTQSVSAAPAQAGGYLPPSFPPLAPPSPAFPPGPPAVPPGRGSGGTRLFVTVAAIVVLAAGGGAYALAASLGKPSGAQPAASASASTHPAASPATSAPAATPSPALSLVAVAPGVTPGAAGPTVETLLSHYFQGINTHSYAEYSGTLDAQQLASQSQSKFESGYSSTTDSGMTLTGLSGSSDGGLTATVTFTSHQSPAESVDNSSCNAWTLNFYLVREGSGYLIGPEPSGYKPAYSDC